MGLWRTMFSPLGYTYKCLIPDSNSSQHKRHHFQEDKKHNKPKRRKRREFLEPRAESIGGLSMKIWDKYSI